MGSKQGNEYNLQTLHRRIAEYYEGMSEPDSRKWTSLEVLMPYIFRFEHLYLAEDYVAAYNVLQQINEPLMQWGHFERLAEMSKKFLVDEEPLPQLELQAQGNIQGHYGQACLGLGELSDAKTHLEKALSAAKDAGNREGEGHWTGSLAFVEMGLAYRDLATGDSEKAKEAMNRFMEALQKLGEALGMAQEAGDRKYVVIWEAMLGMTKQFLAEQLGQDPEKYITEAIAHYKQVEKNAKEIKDRTSQMQVLGSLARIEHERGQFEEARDHSKEALALARDLGNRRAQAAIQGNLGSTQLKLGNMDAAIAHYEQAMALSQEEGDMLGKAIQGNRLLKAYNSLGVRALEQKQFEWAEAYFDKATTYFEEAQSILIKIDPKRETSLRIRQATAQVGRTGCEAGWAEKDDQAGSLAPALAEYQKALGTYPDKGEVRDAIKNLERMQNAGVSGLENILGLLQPYAS